MITCPKCQKQLEDGTQFCDACGEKITETVFCPNCGNATSTEFAFCQNCGATLAAEAAPEAAPAAPKAAPAAAVVAKVKKLPKKLLMIGAAALAAIVLIAVILVIALSGGKNNYVLYMKDNEVFFTQVSKIKPMQVTEDLLDGKDDLTDSAIQRAASQNQIIMSKDGKNLFFGDEFEFTEDGYIKSYTLYYRSAKDAKKEAVKLDSGVNGYMISENGKSVVYMKDGSVYMHNLKEKTKIINEYADFSMSKDMKVFFWTDEEGDLYMKKAGQDKKKLDSEVGDIKYVNEKGSAVWYTKNYDEESGEYDLFKHNTKDKEKVAAEVTSVFGLSDEGTFYFIKKETEEKALFDFVNNDTSEAPEYLVEELKNTKTEYATKTLTYFNGKENKELSTKYESYYDYSTEAEILIFSEAKEVKVKLSEINSIYDVQNALYNPETTYFVALGEKVVEIDAEDADDFTIDEENNVIYYMAEYSKLKEDATDEERANFVSTGTLNKMTISGEKVKKTEQYDEDVYAYIIAKDGSVIVRKEYKMGKQDGEKYIPATYELYVNKEKVSDDVNSYLYDNETGAVAYMTDLDTDPEKYRGTLNYWKNGKKKVVSEDVYDYDFTPEGEVTYLKDYNTKKLRGDLFLFSGKKSKKIDEDVVCIINVILWEDYMKY